MAVNQEHFVGYDIDQGASPLLACPLTDEAATIVWFEKWIDTSHPAFGRLNTGIIYTHSFTSFDMLGNVVRPHLACSGPSCGFAGNLTPDPAHPQKTPDEWLAQARQVCSRLNLPPPGTVQLCPRFAGIIGRRPGG